MKGALITNRGIEDIASLEVKELIKADCIINETVVIFDIKKIEELCLLCYKSQSASKVMLLLGEFKISDLLLQFEDIIKKADLSEFSKPFAVRCYREGTHDFTSTDIEADVGSLIHKKINKKVDLVNPDVMFYVHIYNDRCYFGIDFAGIDLGKRDYKIFTHPNSLKGTIAYSLVRLAQFKDKDVILDPFCGAGIIPIEAALYITGFPINHYRKDKLQFTRFVDFDFVKIDKKIKKKALSSISAYDWQMRFVKAAQKNAKIAGINKHIHFSRIEIEWLDTKLSEKSIDKIITQPPIISKNIDKKLVEKAYSEFFHQAEYLLKDNGTILTISSTDLKPFAAKYSFKLIEEREVWQGSIKLSVCIFGK